MKINFLFTYPIYYLPTGSTINQSNLCGAIWTGGSLLPVNKRAKIFALSMRPACSSFLMRVIKI